MKLKFKLEYLHRSDFYECDPTEVDIELKLPDSTPEEVLNNIKESLLYSLNCDSQNYQNINIKDKK